MTTIRIRISETIENEYANRLPTWLPLEKLDVGVVELTLDEARAVLRDAEHNSDLDVFEIGPYALPLGTWSAYRALAKQIKKALASAAL